MKNIKQRLWFIMEGGSVVRYHTRPGIRPDTDAHHLHGVAMLCAILAGEDEDGRTRASSALLMAALTHDLAEQWASDVSAGAKEALGIASMLAEVEHAKLAEFGFDYALCLLDEERTTLALADQLDCLMYCCREAALGNRNVMLIWGKTCARLENIAAVNGVFDLQLRASACYEALKTVWHEVWSPAGPDFNVFTS